MEKKMEKKMEMPILGVGRLMDVVKDTSATCFIIDNYETLVKVASKMGIDPSMCHDIVHDIYITLLKNEENGNGYSPNKGKIHSYITVEEFVYGMLKKYALNKKYKKDNISTLVEIPSCCDSTEIENMNESQVAYALAYSYDDIETVDLMVSASEELEYCLSFDDETRTIGFLLKNITDIASLDFDKSIFNRLRIMKNKRFVESLRSLIKFAELFPIKYRELVSNI